MGEPEICGGERLVVRSEFVPSQAIEKLIEMDLPLIERLILPDELGKGVSVLQHNIGSPVRIFDDLSVQWQKS
jgi:hypothetical protein